jgi:hypothetical protein
MNGDLIKKTSPKLSYEMNSLELQLEQQLSQEIQTHEKWEKSVSNVAELTSREYAADAYCTVATGPGLRDPSILSLLALCSWEFLFVCKSHEAGLCVDASNTLPLAEPETQFHKHIRNLWQDVLLRLQRAMSATSRLPLFSDLLADWAQSFQASRGVVDLHFCFLPFAIRHQEEKRSDILVEQVGVELQPQLPKRNHQKLAALVNSQSSPYICLCLKVDSSVLGPNKTHRPVSRQYWFGLFWYREKMEVNLQQKKQLYLTFLLTYALVRGSQLEWYFPAFSDSLSLFVSTQPTLLHNVEQATAKKVSWSQTFSEIWLTTSCPMNIFSWIFLQFSILILQLWFENSLRFRPRKTTKNVKQRIVFQVCDPS